MHFLRTRLLQTTQGLLIILYTTEELTFKKEYCDSNSCVKGNPNSLSKLVNSIPLSEAPSSKSPCVFTNSSGLILQPCILLSSFRILLLKSFDNILFKCSTIISYPSWRRARDSNPRNTSVFVAFQVRCIKPDSASSPLCLFIYFTSAFFTTMRTMKGKSFNFHFFHCCIGKPVLAIYASYVPNSFFYCSEHKLI